MTRWSESAYLLLTALAEADNHGYALAQRVGQLGGDDFRIGAGTLYGTLDKLQAAGLIEFVREVVVDGRNRRIYAIAGTGRELLVRRASDLATQAASMHRALGLA